ncbi:MAG: hypothetical protein RJA99_927 [Pseudomonadota bacterium]|jgi:hypothetical protein
MERSALAGRRAGRAAICAALAALLACASAPVQAQADRLGIKADGYLEAEAEAVAAREALFALSRIYAPVCDEAPTWAFGPGVRSRPARRDEPASDKPESEALRAYREREKRLAEAFGLEPGESALIVEPGTSAWSEAGLRRGDRWRTEALWPESGAGAPIDMSTGLPITGPRYWEKFGSALQSRPERSFAAQRGGVELQATVRAAPVCRMGLALLDSRYAYADASGSEVFVTLPLVRALNARELSMLMAFEGARVVLARKDGGAGAVVGELLFGRLAEIAKNGELNRFPPSEAELIQADRLAMFALRTLKIDPPEYLRFVKSMDAREEPFGAPRYSTLRPLPNKRFAALEDSAALFEASRRFRLPAGIPPESLRAMQGVPVPANAPAKPPTSQPESTPPATRVAMPASGFAALDDANALPGISDACRARYTAWLAWAEPRAFVIGPGGRCAFTSGARAPQTGGAADPVVRALDACRRIAGAECKVYAIDREVVWARE